jgi:streptogramin lyase
MKKIITLLIILSGLQKVGAQVVTTLAGSTPGYFDGAGNVAQFYYPEGICSALDASGDFYVSDTFNHKIRKITSAGVVTTLAGSTSGFADGIGLSARFSAPKGICIDAQGNLYIVDSNNHKIRKITQAGVVTTLAGSNQGYIDGTGSAALFSSPSGICIDSDGNLYVTDSGNGRIRKITSAGVVTTIAGFSTPGYSDGTGSAARFNNPYGICINAIGDLYIADIANHRIRKVTQSGIVTTFAGSTQGFADGIGTAAQFDYPWGICINNTGDLYVSDTYNQKIRKISPAGEVTTFAGSIQGYYDGVANIARFFGLVGICTNNSGDLYVADSANHKIRKVTTTLGLDENNLASKIIVYPNPVSSVLKLDTEEVINKIELFDFLGKSIFIKEFPGNTINLDFLSKGIFVLKIFTDRGYVNYKISKE